MEQNKEKNINSLVEIFINGSQWDNNRTKIWMPPARNLMFNSQDTK